MIYLGSDFTLCKNGTPEAPMGWEDLFGVNQDHERAEKVMK